MNKTWNSSKLEDLIINEINELIKNKETINDNYKIIDYDKLISNVDERENRILDLYELGRIDKNKLDQRIQSLEDEKHELIKKKENQNSQQQNVLTPKELKKYVSDLYTADFNKKQSIIQKLIKQIYIHGENIEIAWNF
ncbi:hypothetical protein [Heyndrickxia oleronia]|nr:hypothetical protein [Heyndrickxia oleronia]